MLIFRYPQVLNELQQDYLSRKAYLSYLVRAHQGLVATRQYLEKALERVDRLVRNVELSLLV
jgi:hypothetical protein